MKLKHCPLCGRTPFGPKKAGVSDERTGYNFLMIISCECGLNISRESRHDNSGWCNDTGQAEADVIAAWNRRAPHATGAMEASE